MSSHQYLQLEFSTTGLVLAFRLSSLSFLSLAVPNPAPAVYNLYTYLFNLTLHVVSELLIHIPMKEIFNENTVFLYSSFCFWLYGFLSKHCFVKLLRSALPPLLHGCSFIFSKDFHVRLHLWSIHYFVQRRKKPWHVEEDLVASWSFGLMSIPENFGLRWTTPPSRDLLFAGWVLAAETAVTYNV